MEKYSTARLEEELGLYGYLYNATQMCDRTSPIFDSPSAGWTNGQIFTLDLVVQTFFDVFCFCNECSYIFRLSDFPTKQCTCDKRRYHL